MEAACIQCKLEDVELVKRGILRLEGVLLARSVGRNDIISIAIQDTPYVDLGLVSVVYRRCECHAGLSEVAFTSNLARLQLTLLYPG